VDVQNSPPVVHPLVDCVGSQVEQVRPVRADWRIMSLAYLNLDQREGKASARTTRS
jgi:hypothetical protein